MLYLLYLQQLARQKYWIIYENYSMMGLYFMWTQGDVFIHQGLDVLRGFGIL